MTWNYSVIFQPPYSSPEQPDGLLRQRPDASRRDAEALNSEGHWVESDLAYRIWLGKEDRELAPVDRETAVTHVREWMRLGNWATFPEGFDQGG